MDIRGDNSQVFGNHRQPGESFDQASQKIHGRGGHPTPIHGGFLFGRDFPEGHQTAKVVDPNPIEKPEVPVHSFQPPGISRFFHDLPAVDRIAPALSGFAEIIRRDAGDDLRFLPVIQFEQIRVDPNIRAVIVDIDGNVPDDLNSLLIRIAAKIPPLVEEKVLIKFFPFDSPRQTPFRPLGWPRVGGPGAGPASRSRSLPFGNVSGFEKGQNHPARKTLPRRKPKILRRFSSF